MQGGNGKARGVLVALWMDGVFGSDVMDGIHAEIAARALPWRIRFVDSPASFETTLRWMLRSGSLSGVITRYHGGPNTDAAHRARVPTVWLMPDSASSSSARRPHPPRTAFVERDLAAVARAAADHFLSRSGFRSASYVENYWDHGWSRRRGDAIEAEFKSRGLRFSRFRHYDAPSPQHPATGPDFDALSDWLRALEKPAAVVAANDATGADVIELCNAAGIAVPRDVAVLGMDDNPAHCRHCSPALSSIRFDGRGAGRLCVAALARMTAGGAAPRSPLLYGVDSIALRASTGAVSTAGAMVQKALDFIDENACRGISLAQVAAHLGVSRSLATQRFREVRGTSVLGAIHERRVAEAKRLLASSDKSLDDVAAACGFGGGADCLRRVFRAATGLSPAQWRGRGAARE